MPEEFLIVIPARFKSSRFPGKPLIDINGKSMIRRVWEKSVEASSSENVIIATDDKRIEGHCLENGMQTIMTSKDCLTGTDRVAEVAKQIDADFYINVQGDEPLINPRDIEEVIRAFKENPICTYCAMSKADLNDDYNNHNIPKVVTANDGSLLYISRAGIPANKEGSSVPIMKQICIYAFPKNHLDKFGLGKDKTKLESLEDIELLRLIELGCKVKMLELNTNSIAIDTPEDLRKVLKILNK